MCCTSQTRINVQLQGKTDARFVEAAFKICRDKFGLRPVITAAQFLEQASFLSLRHNCSMHASV